MRLLASGGGSPVISSSDLWDIMNHLTGARGVGRMLLGSGVRNSSLHDIHKNI